MKIEPTSKFEKDVEEVYTLEDKDFLLITALNNLTHAIRSMK